MKINIISILLNWDLYKQFKDRKAGKPICDFDKGAGYYLPIGLCNSMIIGRQETWDMKSEKQLNVKCINYEAFDDPKDMTKTSEWQAMGYVGEIPFSEMTWEQYYEQHKK